MHRPGVLPSPLVEYLYTHRYDSPVGPLFLAVDRSGTVYRVSYSDLRAGLVPI